jgi:hypothetical protein
MNFETTPLGDYVQARTAPASRARAKSLPPNQAVGMKTVFLEGDKLEVAVKNDRWVLTNLPAGPRPAAELLRCYFPDD